MYKNLFQVGYNAFSGLLMGTALLSMLALPIEADAGISYSGKCQVTSTSEAISDSGPMLAKWSEISKHADNSKVQQDVHAMNAGIAYVTSNTGAVMLKMPNKYLNGKVDFIQNASAPVVMAFYDPQTSVGRIWVDRAIRVGGNVLVEQLPFSPQDGIMMSTAYDHNNPFWQFVQGRNGNPRVNDPNAFVKIQSNAFFAAAGMVMRHFGADRGMIASLDVNSHKHKSTSGNIFKKKVTETVTYDAHPVWTMMLPSGSAPNGYSDGYKLPICNPVTGSPLTASSLSKAKSEAALWSNAQTEAGPSSVSYQGQDWGSLNVSSGVEYISQGSHPLGFNTSSWQVYQYSKSKSGWTTLSMGLFAIALGALTSGLATYAIMAYGSAAMSAATTAAFSSIGMSAGFGAGAVVGAGATAAASLMYDTNCLGLCGSQSGHYALYGHANQSSESFAGHGAKVNTNLSVTSFNFNQYLQTLYSSRLKLGVSHTKYSSSPEITWGSKGVVGYLTNAADANQLGAPGSLGGQARNSANNAQSTAPSTPSSLGKQYTNGSTSSLFGALPPAP